MELVETRTSSRTMEGWHVRQSSTWWCRRKEWSRQETWGLCPANRQLPSSIDQMAQAVTPTSSAIPEGLSMTSAGPRLKISSRLIFVSIMIRRHPWWMRMTSQPTSRLRSKWLLCKRRLHSRNSRLIGCPHKKNVASRPLIRQKSPYKLEDSTVRNAAETARTNTTWQRSSWREERIRTCAPRRTWVRWLTTNLSKGCLLTSTQLQTRKLSVSITNQFGMPKGLAHHSITMAWMCLDLR